MTEKKIESLESSPSEPGPADWLYTNDGAEMGCKPFIVAGKHKIYGSIPQLVSRCGFFAALTGDIRSLKEASERAPFVLLADDKRFDSGMLESFNIVWNYINGVYPDLVLKEQPDFIRPVAVWPREGMTIEEKYRVLYFCDYFSVPAGTDSKFLEEYARLLVTDLEKEMKSVAERHAALAGSQGQVAVAQEYNKLVQMALTLRNVIMITATLDGDDYLGWFGNYMHPEQKQEMKYGKRDPGIPAAYKEIYPDAKGMFSYDQLNEAKDLTVQLYRFGKALATFKIIEVGMTLVSVAYNSSIFTVDQRNRAIHVPNAPPQWPPALPPDISIIELTRADGVPIVQFVTSYYVTSEWLTPGFDDPKLSNQQVNMRAFSA